VVALTFDDGPDPRWTPAVLDLLRRYRARATFCLVGVHARRHPELVRRIAAEGHVLCNHTWSHPARLDLQPAATVRKQLLDTNQAITAAAGGTVPRFFRAPGGRWSPVVRAEAARLDLSPLRWSVDPADWAGAAAPAISQRVLARTEPGAIVLLHDGYGNRAATVAALPVILAALSRDGYRFGTP
jgi:peptidoglycan/xylan/chitin deacetylase (PgdA/CDA1 family)